MTVEPAGRHLPRDVSLWVRAVGPGRRLRCGRRWTCGSIDGSADRGRSASTDEATSSFNVEPAVERGDETGAD